MVTFDFKLADIRLEGCEAYLLNLGENLSKDFEVILIVIFFRFLERSYAYNKINYIFLKFQVGKKLLRGLGRVT